MNASDFGADIFDGEGESEAPPPSAASKKTRKTRSRRKTAPEAGSPPEPAAAPAEPSDRGPVTAAETPPSGETTAADDTAAGTAGTSGADVAAPKKKRRRRKSTNRKATAPEAEGEPVAEEAMRSREPEEESEPVVAWEAEDDFDPDAEGPADADEPEPRDADHGDDDRSDADSSDADSSDAEFGESEGEPRAGGRRRRRRRRRGGRGGDDDTPEEDRGAEHPARPAEPAHRTRHRTGRMIPVPTPEGEIRGARVAVLLNLDPLIEQAREAGGEVAYGKLLQRVTRRRHLIRAIAYSDARSASSVATTLRGSGIETHAIPAPADLPISIAVDAMALATRVDSIVLIPDAAGLSALTAALRAHGVRVETASFTDGADADDDIVQTRHELGAESLFVP